MTGCADCSRSSRFSRFSRFRRSSRFSRPSRLPCIDPTCDQDCMDAASMSERVYAEQGCFSISVVVPLSSTRPSCRTTIRSAICCTTPRSCETMTSDMLGFAVADGCGMPPESSRVRPRRWRSSARRQAMMLRIVHDGTRDGHTLRLPAGKIHRVPVWRTSAGSRPDHFTAMHATRSCEAISSLPMPLMVQAQRLALRNVPTRQRGSSEAKGLLEHQAGLSRVACGARQSPASPLSGRSIR